MTNPQFTSDADADTDLFLFPSVELRERDQPLKNPEKIGFTLPDDLCGLSDPQPHEIIGVLRFLAFRMARVLFISEWPNGLQWYESYCEDTSFDDYLEVATAILAALNTRVESTSTSGDISVYIDPRVEDLKEFFLDEFVPMAHFLRTANPDGLDDFEYDFDSAFIDEDELRESYSLRFFSDETRIVNLDPIFRYETDDEDSQGVVAVKKDGESPLQPRRDFTEPLDRLLLSVIGVIRFFKMSSEISDVAQSDDDELIDEDFEQELREYIEEFPEEKDTARETLKNYESKELFDYDFSTESCILRELGITSVATDDDGWLRATLSPPINQEKNFASLGLLDDPDSFFDPFTNDEPVGVVRLGWYEYVFFTEEDEDE